MKLVKKLYLIALFSINAFSQETIVIPDIGLEEALIDLKFDSNGLNGNILVSDAQYIVNLNINSPLDNDLLPNVNSKIKDLTGLEHFPNLTRLDCSGNEISKINLTKNSKLSFLNCRDNKITSLDLSNNPELFSVSCDYNKISTLVLGEKPLLRDLFCNNNRLTTADISQCPILENLDISLNKISKIFIDKDTYDKYSVGWHKDSNAKYTEKTGNEVAEQVVQETVTPTPAPTTTVASSSNQASTASIGNNSAANYFEKFKQSVITEYDQLVLDPTHLQNTKDDIQRKYAIEPTQFTQWITQYGKLKMDQVNQSKSIYTLESTNNFYKKFQQEAVEEYEKLVLDPTYLQSKKEIIQKKYNISPQQFTDWVASYGKLTDTNTHTREEASEYYDKFKKAVVSEYERAVLNPTHLQNKKDEIQKKYNLSVKDLGDWILQLSSIYRN